MARITTYAIDSAISGKDKLVGSDAEDSNITKNYLIADLANYIGTSNTGAQGPEGPAGSNGTNGSDGTNGTNGSNGTNGTNGTDGTQGAAGADGTSISILGTVANCAALPTTGNTTGDLYILDAADGGCSYGAGAEGDGYVWTAGNSWLNIGPLRGPQGIQGIAGTDGTDGSDGTDGTNGTDGTDGTDGAQGPQGIQGSLSSSEALSLVGLDLSWSNRDPLYAVNSTYITNLVYSRLGVDFNNLDFEAGSIYKLILERKRKATTRSSGGNNFRKGGYKRSTGYGMQPPYSNRLSEIIFNEATGAKFDFGWDLFFQQNAFPRPSGISTTTGGVNVASADIHFALRISKQTGNITEVSPVLTEFTLRGIYNPSQNGIDKQKRLTFILK